MALLCLIVGVVIGYIFAMIKVWDSILQTWQTRDITLTLDDQANADWRLGWLEGHRSLVRELDASPWIWWRKKHAIAKEVLHEEERSS